MLADYHMHTNHSDDSEVTMEQYIAKAKELGLNEIAFTDHLEFAIKTKFFPDYKKYYEDYKNLVEDNKNITLKFGAEFGIQSDNIQKFEEVFASTPFDFILLSCHTIDGLGLWNGDYIEGKTQKEYNEGYYNEILKVVSSYKNYSVLAHLDLIRRYDSSYYEFKNVKTIIEKILKQAIKDGKGLEVNTSSHRYNIPDLTPSVEILKLYKELGGEIITIGSDSHAIAHLGKFIKETHYKLRELGFEHFYTFEKMKPIQHDLLKP